MNGTGGERLGVVLNPPHPGERVRENMEVGWDVTETAARLACERGILSRLLDGKADVSDEDGVGVGGPQPGHGRSQDADAGEL